MESVFRIPISTQNQSNVTYKPIGKEIQVKTEKVAHSSDKKEKKTKGGKSNIIKFVNDEGIIEEQEVVYIDDEDPEVQEICSSSKNYNGVDIYGLPMEQFEQEFDKKLGRLGFGNFKDHIEKQNQPEIQHTKEEKEEIDIEQLSNWSIDTSDLEKMDIEIDSDDEEEYKMGHKICGAPEQLNVIPDETSITHLSYNFSTHKAGLENVNKEYVNKVITEASENSAFAKNQTYRIRAIKNKIRRFKYRIKQFKANTQLWNKVYHEVQRRLMWFKNERSFKRTWIHVDMDMFYAAVEIKDNPFFADKPLVVGEKGMVSTSNYIARNFGIKSGMPIFIAKKLCSNLLVAKPNFVRYKEISDEMKTILREYDPDLESWGLDEANIDITEYLKKNSLDHSLGRLYVAHKIRKTIFERIEMTCSVGISWNKMMAKVRLI